MRSFPGLPFPIRKSQLVHVDASDGRLHEVVKSFVDRQVSTANNSQPFQTFGPAPCQFFSSSSGSNGNSKASGSQMPSHLQISNPSIKAAVYRTYQDLSHQMLQETWSSVRDYLEFITSAYKKWDAWAPNV